MADLDAVFAQLAVQRALVTEQVARQCLAARAPGVNFPRLLAERGGLTLEAARALYGEATRHAQAAGPGPPGGGIVPAGLAGTSPPTPTSSEFGSTPWAQQPARKPAPPSSGAPPALELRPGMSFGRYVLDHELGRGGMGLVWKARHVDLDRDVAIKMLLPHLLGRPKIRDRFLREARAVARLQHPNLVTVHDVGEERQIYPGGGVLFFSMDFVAGPSLSQLLREQDVSVDRALEIAQGVAEGLEHAHQQGIVHRDLKPANVLIDPSGRARVTDFGIAKDTTSHDGGTLVGELLGTPGYMAPEQAAGQALEADPRADVYALGAILYRMLGGRPPFQGANHVETLNQIMHDPPTPLRELDPAVPPGVEELVHRCLAKARGERPGSAREVAQELGALRRGSAPTGSSWRAAAVGAVALLLVVVGLGAELWRRLDAAEAARVALAEQAEEQRRRAEEQEVERARQALAAKLDQADGLAASAPGDALALATEVTDGLPDLPEGHLLRARLLVATGDPRAALAAAERAGEAGAEALVALRARAAAWEALLAAGADEQDAALRDADAASRLGSGGRALAADLRTAVALANGDLEAAVARLGQGVREEPDDDDRRLRLAELMLKARRFASANGEASRILERQPTSPGALAVRARARLELSRLDAAERDAREALRHDPQSPLAREVLAEVERRRPPPAPPPTPGPGPPHLGLPLPTAPGAGGEDPRHQRTHAAIKAAMAAVQRRDPATASRQLAVALAEQPMTCAGALWERAMLARMLGRLPEALADLQALQQQQPDEPKVLGALASLLGQLQRPEEALALLGEAIGRSPRPAGLLVLRGQLLVQAQQPERALDDLTRALELEAGQLEAHHQRAHALLALNRHQEALSDTDRLLQSSPASGHFHVMRGDCLAGLGREAEARQAFTEATERGSPKDKAEAAQKLAALGGGQ